MFSRSAPFVATTREWAVRSARRNSPERAAEAYARQNMVAIIMKGDDSAIAFLYDVANNRVARVVYPKVEWK